MSFLQKWEYILPIKKMDSRLHGNDKMGNFPMIGKIEITSVIDKIKIVDSRFHGNGKKHRHSHGSGNQYY